MSNQVYYNPPVPFETMLNNVQPGLTVTVQGRRVPGNKIFFQFQTGPGPHADIAFRFVPRWVNRPEVIGNSRIGGNWGNESLFVAGSTPLGNPGQNFQIMFVIEQNQFKVAINGSHFCTYPHRMNMYNIKYFGVENAAALTQVSVYNQSVGAPSPGYQPPAQGGAPILNPANETPINIPLPNIRDHSVTICGVPMRGRFSIQFLNSSNPPDIFFFLNPRIGMQTVARNSCYQSVWGAEETAISRAFPFIPGQAFQIEISVDRQCFRVSLNGMHLCDFHHRQRPLNQITRMKFSGNVRISSVTFR